MSLALVPYDLQRPRVDQRAFHTLQYIIGERCASSGKDNRHCAVFRARGRHRNLYILA